MTAGVDAAAAAIETGRGILGIEFGSTRIKACLIGDDSIGRGIVETLRGHRSRAVLMQNHGPFTIGVTARDAVKAAIMCEDAARSVQLAMQGGPLIPIPQDQIDRLYAR